MTPRGILAPAQPDHGRPRHGIRLVALPILATVLALALAGCYPPPETLDFASDPRIFHGSYSGTIELRGDGSEGQLNIELESTARYVNSNAYAVSGTVRLKGTAETGDSYDLVGTFTGVVNGGGTQRYLAPQVSPPPPAHLILEVDGAPWRFRAVQSSRYHPGELGESGWMGSAFDPGDGSNGHFHTLRLWRAP